MTSEATESGTANLFGLDLPAADSNSAMRRINRLALAMRKAGDPRTMDQIRADIFLDLLNGRNNSLKPGPNGVVDTRVDLTTLVDLDDKTGEIPGWGPVIADIARQVVTEQEHAEWRFTVTDPETGQVIHDGTTRRRPTAAQRRRTEAQHPTCVFFTCRMSSSDSDIDHRRSWIDGGPTEDHNLAPLCRHDHMLKHHGWSVEMMFPGVFIWTSPLGLTYIVETQPP
ncbi:MAG: HNH endonuclease [Acidimicrobiia bacterium]